MFCFVLGFLCTEWGSVFSVLMAHAHDGTIVEIVGVGGWHGCAAQSSSSFMCDVEGRSFFSFDTNFAAAFVEMRQ